MQIVKILLSLAFLAAATKVSAQELQNPSIKLIDLVENQDQFPVVHDGILISDIALTQEAINLRLDFDYQEFGIDQARIGDDSYLPDPIAPQSLANFLCETTLILEAFKQGQRIDLHYEFGNRNFILTLDPQFGECMTVAFQSLSWEPMTLETARLEAAEMAATWNEGIVGTSGRGVTVKQFAFEDDVLTMVLLVDLSAPDFEGSTVAAYASDAEVRQRLLSCGGLEMRSFVEAGLTLRTEFQLQSGERFVFSSRAGDCGRFRG